LQNGFQLLPLFGAVLPANKINKAVIFTAELRRHLGGKLGNFPRSFPAHEHHVFAPSSSSRLKTALGSKNPKSEVVQLRRTGYE